MLELARLLPRRFLAGSIGAGILYFLIQVSWLSWYAFDQCRAADDSGLQGCIWYMYKQVPSALPLAAVFAAGLMVVADMLGRFADSFPSTNQSSKWGGGDWLWIILLVSSTAVVALGFTVFADAIPLPVTLLFVVILYWQITQPWVAWSRRVVGAGRNGEGEGEERE